MTTVNKFYDEIEINELCFFPFALINNWMCDDRIRICDNQTLTLIVLNRTASLAPLSFVQSIFPPGEIHCIKGRPNEKVNCSGLSVFTISE